MHGPKRKRRKRSGRSGSGVLGAGHSSFLPIEKSPKVLFYSDRRRIIEVIEKLHGTCPAVEGVGKRKLPESSVAWT